MDEKSPLGGCEGYEVHFDAGSLENLSFTKCVQYLCGSKSPRRVCFCRLTTNQSPIHIVGTDVLGGPFAMLSYSRTVREAGPYKAPFQKEKSP